ncbi:MAG: S49 family peptidase [Planctomycetaceae bacterium]|nr:S49 family peptidase [Planctomycetaceae bacterium]
MLYLDGQIWSVHPMAVSSAREAVAARRADERNRIPATMEGMGRALPIEYLPLEYFDGVPVVTIQDVIVCWQSCCYTSHPVLQQTFRHLMEQQPADGRAILLIDSPGGMAKGSAETIDALNALQDAGVTVTAQVRGGCMSAAYKIASQCRGGIFAHRMDEIGNIGTRIVLEDYSRRFKDLGIEIVPITNEGADFKLIGELGLPVTDQQKKFLQSHLEGVFQDFRECVMSGRNMTATQFAAVSDGRWWLPEDAQKLGLIDGIRTFEETLASTTPTTSSTLTREEQAMPTDSKPGEQKPTQSATATEQNPAVTAPATAGTPATTEQKPAATQTGTATAPAAGESSATNGVQLAELQKWVATFGAENGTKWFLESGCDYTQALERHVALQKSQLEQAQQQASDNGLLLKQIAGQLTELDPLQLERKGTGDEAGASEQKKGLSIQEILAARNRK